MKNAILACLPGDFPWAATLQCFDTLDSTNTLARQLAADGAPHGTVLIAEAQTGGRGRMGRSFHSPGGMGIYLSVLLRPQCPARELMHLTCAAAVAMCDAVEKACGLRPGIKWTNDLVWGRRKLGGILTELSLDSLGNARWAVVGIGINCAQTPEDFPPELRDMAASLAMVTGRRPDRAALAAAMTEALEKMSRSLLTDREAMLERYRADCVTLGRQISVVDGDRVRHGTALSVDSQGALVVQFSDGTREAVSSGEVSIRGMYGYV